MFKKIIETAVIAVLAAAALGQLPRLVHAVRVAQLQILKDSESKKWGRPFLLPVQQARHLNSRRAR